MTCGPDIVSTEALRAALSSLRDDLRATHPDLAAIFSEAVIPTLSILTLLDEVGAAPRAAETPHTGVNASSRMRRVS